ncbi:tRNA epoxyqueuosine(34) reductase QueG [Gemmata sp. JC673]|uniref:tRNA epoxyqueuosine(34) reductase QueG n=1 Tax=Gemmata algarum TaxID=2975278 RepID=A0ABU5F2D6_9BACT|nr:tRNA epoxyqueuosine(34) reductase QueG [Gemmata algarum]MDY3561669.1 tRNA epoxyqueuosine(34) reductase QueG [Gemmata algarum]
MGDLEERLKAEAARLGFALSGIAPATDADGFGRFAAWLDRGFAGEMSYLPKLRAERQHPRSVLDDVRSVLMVGLEYSGVRNLEFGIRSENETQEKAETSSTNSPSAVPHSEFRTPHFGRVAAYAAGPDYHRYIWDRLNALAAWLEEQVPGSRTEAVADTAPLLERDFARRAGLGWVGKNTMLINTRRGSFFFLGAVLTTLELAPDPPATSSHCGTCTRCLEACPTGAFTEPYVLDARKCISYLTVELRSEIPVELREPMGHWLYGCDVCQDVCPWNRNAGERTVALPHDPDLAWLDPIELLGLDAEAFRKRFKKTSLFRNRRPGLLRNAAVVLGNIGDSRAVPALEQALADSEETIREAAAWALARIRARMCRS